MSTIEEEAVKLVSDEKNDWQEMAVDLTEQISFKCRNIIKKARKNYFSIYDNPYDPVTNRRKLYVPMTRDMVETTVKNVDIDTKDIDVRAKTHESYIIAGLAKMILRSKLDKLRFGQLLNRVIRRSAVEGVTVLKHLKSHATSTISIVENLNFYTDPTVNYLCESTGNIEENWLTIDEAKSYPWDNLSELTGQTSIERVSDLPIIATKIPHVKITERWGLMPKYFLTKDESDKDEYIEGIIIISNMNSGPIVHLIAENKSKNRPYVEFRLKQYDGRWLGLGISEDIFDLQSYINEVFNIRLNTNRIKQLGLFQIRKGSGITPQMLTQLHGAGGIQVSGINKDIAELRTSDMKPSSYKDEDMAYLWAQRMTGNWQIGRGEALPASQPATTAVLQERGMQTGFSLQQEELGFSISKFIEELLLPSILDSLTEKEIVRITDDPKLLEELDEVQITHDINEAIIGYHKKNNEYPNMGEIEMMKAKARDKFRETGKDRFVEVKKSLLSPKNILDSVDVYVTSEGFNKQVLAKNLNDLLLNYSRIEGINIDADMIIKEILDLMGLSGERFIKRPVPQPMVEGMAGPMGQGLQPAQPVQGPVRQAGRPPMATAEAERVAEAATSERGGRALVPSL